MPLHVVGTIVVLENVLKVAISAKSLVTVLENVIVSSLVTAIF